MPTRLSRKLEEASVNGVTTLSVAQGRHRYTFDLAAGQQVNEATKKTRGIERHPPLPAAYATTPCPPLTLPPSWTLGKWQFDEYGFRDMPSTLAQRLDAALAAGAAKIQGTHDGNRYEFDLQRMSQVNVEVGTRRAIKREPPLALVLVATSTSVAPSMLSATPPAAAATPTGAWQYLEGNGAWTDMPVALSDALQAASALGQPTATLSRGGFTYLFDLSAMLQTNQQTHRSRWIRRSDAAVNSSLVALPAISATAPAVLAPRAVQPAVASRSATDDVMCAISGLTRAQAVRVLMRCHLSLSRAGPKPAKVLRHATN